MIVPDTIRNINIRSNENKQKLANFLIWQTEKHSPQINWGGTEDNIQAIDESEVTNTKYKRLMERFGHERRWWVWRTLQRTWHTTWINRWICRFWSEWGTEHIAYRNRHNAATSNYIIINVADKSLITAMVSNQIPKTIKAYCAPLSMLALMVNEKNEKIKRVVLARLAGEALNEGSL